MVEGVNIEKVSLKDQLGFKDSKARLPVLANRTPGMAAQPEFIE